MKPFQFTHGWTAHGYRNDISLFIGPLPDRKQIALYQIRDGQQEVLAYFRSFDAAVDAYRLLEQLVIKPKRVLR